MSFNFVPNTTAEEIEQNVKVISRVVRGTQPLNRALGLDPEILDMPGQRGMALLQAEIIDQLPQQEPRINVKKVSFTGDAAAAQYEPVIEYEVV